QAEDGIRDKLVTGVQTCALPICIINVANIFGIGSIRIEKRLGLVVTLKDWHELEEVDRIGLDQESYEILGLQVPHVTIPVKPGRSEERRVGKEVSSQWLLDLENE